MRCLALDGVQSLVSLRHHTQDKGDTGQAFVIACLTSHGIKIALPISEHLPFDLIAISEVGELSKVSVKYRSAVNGKVEVLLRSQWKAKSGTQRRNWHGGEVDCHALYCPETGECYFVRDEEVVGQTLTLRIQPPKRHQPGVKMASDYLDPARMFGT